MKRITRFVLTSCVLFCALFDGAAFALGGREGDGGYAWACFAIDAKEAIVNERLTPAGRAAIIPDSVVALEYHLIEASLNHTLLPGIERLSLERLRERFSGVPEFYQALTQAAAVLGPVGARSFDMEQLSAPHDSGDPEIEGNCGKFVVVLRIVDKFFVERMVWRLLEKNPFQQRIIQLHEEAYFIGVERDLRGSNRRALHQTSRRTQFVVIRALTEDSAADDLRAMLVHYGLIDDAAAGHGQEDQTRESTSPSLGFRYDHLEYVKHVQIQLQTGALAVLGMGWSMEALQKARQPEDRRMECTLALQKQLTNRHSVDVELQDEFARVLRYIDFAPPGIEAYLNIGMEKKGEDKYTLDLVLQKGQRRILHELSPGTYCHKYFPGADLTVEYELKSRTLKLTTKSAVETKTSALLGSLGMKARAQRWKTQTSQTEEKKLNDQQTFDSDTSLVENHIAWGYFFEQLSLISETSMERAFAKLDKGW